MNDKKIQEAIEREAERQLYNIELIASENYVSRDVLEAAGSILTNKICRRLSEQALLRRLCTC